MTFRAYHARRGFLLLLPLFPGTCYLGHDGAWSGGCWLGVEGVAWRKRVWALACIVILSLSLSSLSVLPFRLPQWMRWQRRLVVWMKGG